MDTLSRHGAQFRTKLLCLPHAQSFAEALRANAMWDSVEVFESRRAKGERRWYVAYEPASDGAKKALVRRHQDRRAARATAELDEYLIVPDEGGRFFWVQSASGEVYEVTRFDCSCPDHEFRCREAGIRCKHQLALEAATEQGKVLAP